MVQLGKSGAGTDAKESCKYFDELNELFGRRPINNKKGIDSLSSAGKSKANGLLLIFTMYELIIINLL